MKAFRTNKGPFLERPYYSLGEIEQICAEELKAAKLYPDSPEPIRIERFITKRFGIDPQYEELPAEILGFSRFGQRGVEAIVVSRELVEDGRVSAERRVNTTLAHEAGHALLHAHLFVMGAPTTPLFDDVAHSPRILCRDEATGGRPSGYDGRWWEYQANQAIGALLLPRELLVKATKAFLSTRGQLGGEYLREDQRHKAIAHVSGTFDVNGAVARYRLEEVYPQNQNQQLTL